jgi:thiamine pyrophosphokinase
VNERIVIISGSAPLDRHVVEAIPEEAIILAADGALDMALAAGLEPGGLIGDLDSVSPEGLAWAQRHATIARHPTDKDHTDTELALEFAADMDPAQLTLIGGGDRLDHTLAAIGALGAPRLTSVPVIDGWWAGQHIDVVHGPSREELLLVPSSRLSLLALHGPCVNVSLGAVKWVLDGADLAPVVGHGVSNVVDDGEPGDDAVAVPVSLSTGVLTIFDDPVHLEHRMRDLPS